MVQEPPKAHIPLNMLKGLIQITLALLGKLCSYIYIPIHQISENESRKTKKGPDDIEDYPQQNLEEEKISKDYEDDFDENSTSSAEEFECTLIKTLVFSTVVKDKSRNRYRKRRKKAVQSATGIDQKWAFFSKICIFHKDLYKCLKQKILQLDLRYGAVFLWIIFFLQLSVANGSNVPRSCQKSMDTIREVNACPSNAEEFKLAERRAKCMDVKQNCTIPKKFKYHCVLDTKGKLIEVCAVEFNSINKLCTHYNYGGQRIQNNNKICKECTSNRIMSPEMYQYKGCLQSEFIFRQVIKITIKRNQTNGLNAMNNKTNAPLPTDENTGSHITSKVVVSVILVVLSLGTLFCVIWFFRTRKKDQEKASKKQKNSARENLL